MTAPLAPFALDGSLDASFGTNGFSDVPYAKTTAAVGAAVEADGTIVSLGQYVTPVSPLTLKSTNQIMVTGMRPDGTLLCGFGNEDETGAQQFGDGVQVIDINGNAIVYSGDAITLDTSGRILIAGAARTQPGGAEPLHFFVARLTPQGHLDTTFAGDGIANIPVGATSGALGLAIAQDGTIWAAGTATESGNKEFAAVHLDSAGTATSTITFRPGVNGAPTYSDGGAWGVTAVPGGDVILGGSITVNGSKTFTAAAIKPGSNGTADAIDQDFGKNNGQPTNGMEVVPAALIGANAPGLGIEYQPAMVSEQHAGVVLFGQANKDPDCKNQFGLPSKSATVVRLDAATGAPDKYFGSGSAGEADGKASACGFTKSVNGIAVDPVGNILLGAGGMSAIRFTPTGAGGIPDPTFDADGDGDGVVTYSEAGTANGSANGIAVQPCAPAPCEEQLVLAGASAPAGGGAAQLSLLRIDNRWTS